MNLPTAERANIVTGQHQGREIRYLHFALSRITDFEFLPQRLGGVQLHNAIGSVCVHWCMWYGMARAYVGATMAGDADENGSLQDSNARACTIFFLVRKLG